MRELELKAVVTDSPALTSALAAAGASLVFEGTMHDRRYDTVDRALVGRDEVLRLRVERSGAGERAALQYKGAASFPEGYKLRQEMGTQVSDAAMTHALLSALGYVVTREIDRRVAVYELAGATVRVEWYPRMDTLVEVEGEPPTIEAAITRLGLPRDAFSGDSLAAFATNYQLRTGVRAAICDRELDDDFRYRIDDA